MQINPRRVVDFSSDIFLVPSFLGKFLMYCALYVNSTILVRLVGYSLLKCNWKNYNYMLTIDHFLSFRFKKGNSLFPSSSVIAIRSSALKVEVILPFYNCRKSESSETCEPVGLGSATSSEVKSSQVKSSQVKSSQVKSS